MFLGVIISCSIVVSIIQRFDYLVHVMVERVFEFFQLCAFLGCWLTKTVALNCVDRIYDLTALTPCFVGFLWSWCHIRLIVHFQCFNVRSSFYLLRISESQTTEVSSRKDKNVIELSENICDNVLLFWMNFEMDIFEDMKVWYIKHEDLLHSWRLATAYMSKSRWSW